MKVIFYKETCWEDSEVDSFEEIGEVDYDEGCFLVYRNGELVGHVRNNSFDSVSIIKR